MREDRPGGAGGQRSIDVDHDRERLRDLSARLMKLHRALLDRERRRYEDRRGSIPSGELLQVVITDPQFAWLRSLSVMVAEIDATVDAGDPMTEETVARMFQGAYRLLKAGGDSEFQLKYLDALQDSPDVVMAHAEVSRVLPASLSSKGPS
jgi:hypothetical protein